VVESPHICHGEFLAESIDDPLQKTRGGGSKNNVINIKKQEFHICTPAIYEQGAVSLRFNKTERGDMSSEAVMPGPRCLLQTIK
jgi:hypothetical protein